MRKWLLLAPMMLAAAAWSQSIPDVVPITLLGGLVIPSGTDLKVRVDEALGTDRNERGDRFTATLMDPVIVNGQAALPAGTRLVGHVLANHQAGVFKGRAHLMLALDSFQYSGHSYPIELTAATYQTEHKHRKLEDRDPNADAVVGNREEVTLPAETVVHFTLGAPVRV